MLTLNRSSGRGFVKVLLVTITLLAGASGAYLLLLVLSPVAAPYISVKPIDIAKLPAPSMTENRIIIPKIGVNIAYAEGEAALDRGAQWRAPSSGNPQDGGNFVIAAHRFSIQPTPQSTIEKSPFYHIDSLAIGDKVVIDYGGKRYGYEITKRFDAKPTDIEIERRTEDPTLTLYSCELSGSDAGRIVFQAKRLGQVDVSKT